MNIHHIFFHDDIDGIISAALYLYYNKEAQARLYPVSSTMRGERFASFFNQIIKGRGGKKIILDYEYNENADLWIDHHFDSDFGDFIVSGKKIEYNSKSLSAAKLVEIHFSKEESDLHSDLLNDVDIIDSCGYKSIDQVFKDVKPIMVLRAYLEQISPNETTYMIYCRIVEIINMCNLDIDDAIYRLRISSYYVKELEKNAMKIKNSMVLSEKISIVNQKNIHQFPRYAEFLVSPDIKYSIRTMNIGNNYLKISIGYNRWHKEKNQFNLGKIRNFDLVKQWGGHYNIGSGVILESNINEFIDITSKMLNDEEDCEMEKYAVDKADPVEKKAEELIKIGEAKNLSDARGIASKNKPETITTEGSDEPRKDV